MSLTCQKFVFFSLAIAGFPFFLLWTYPDAVFGADWSNHLWILAYFSEYWRAHHAFPEVIHTSNNVGMTFPVFYGVLLYPILGVLRTGLGLSVPTTMRLAIFAIAVLQFYAVYRLASRVLRNQWQAVFTATLFSWTLYPLVNIYLRGACPEFFATTFLVIAISALVLLFFGEEKYSTIEGGALFVLSYGLMVGSHSITAYYGSWCIAFFFMVCAWTLHTLKRMSLTRILWRCAFIAVPAFIQILPWLIPVLQFRGDLVANRYFGSTAGHYPALDGALLRFFPFVVNPATFLDQAELPYFSAPVNVVLLGLVFLLAIGRLRSDTEHDKRHTLMKRYVIVGVLLASLCGWVSISPAASEKVSRIFSLRYFQFSYRMVTYANLGLLLVFVGLQYLKQFHRKKSPWIIGMAVTLSGLGVALVFPLAKDFAAKSAQSSFPNYVDASRKGVIQLNPAFYGEYDYTTPGLFNEWKGNFQPVKLDVDSDGLFGHVQSKEFSAHPTQWICTNIHAFPWNGLYVDERRIPSFEIKQHDNRLCFLSPARKHRLSYRFESPVYLKQVRTAALWVLAAAFVAWTLTLFWARLIIPVFDKCAKTYPSTPADPASAS